MLPFRSEIKYEFSGNSEVIVEILDQSGKPLCFMNKSQLVEQRLFHKAIAVNVCTEKGKYLLKDAGENLFDIVLFAPLQAGNSSIEFAEKLLYGFLPQVKGVSFKGIIPPCNETNNAFTNVFTSICSESLLHGYMLKEFMLADIDEIDYLRNRKYLTPLCFMIFDKLCEITHTK